MQALSRTQVMKLLSQCWMLAVCNGVYGVPVRHSHWWSLHDPSQDVSTFCCSQASWDLDLGNVSQPLRYSLPRGPTWSGKLRRHLKSSWWVIELLVFVEVRKLRIEWNLSVKVLSALFSDLSDWLYIVNYYCLLQKATRQISSRCDEM